MQSDAQQESAVEHCNMDILTLDMIPLIEKELDPYDMISLVFLLYDVPNTALERLTIYQRVSKDIRLDSNLLHDWVLHAQAKPSWKKELVESLNTCQLYSIIRKIGLSVPAVKEYFQYTKETLLNPMKKELYKLCEHINADNLIRLKKTLLTYDIDVSHHETCEMLLLELMCRRFITLNNKAKNTQNDIKNLAKIIENFSDLCNFANDLRILECNLNKEFKSKNTFVTSTPSATVKDNMIEDNKEQSNKYLQDLKETFDEFNKLHIDVPIDNIKSDMVLARDAYEIKNPNNTGVCLIINQEKFHPSKYSIEGKVPTKLLEDRKGSTKDKNVLMETMKELNFDVITRDNLDHIAMIDCIKNVIKYRVHDEHSMFMLCILSHGTKGHIYAADCIKIKVEDIENLLDSDDAVHLRDKPKLMILQACQVKDDDSAHAALVADSPKPIYKYYIKKSDIIIYWATAPNYEAFRHEEMGSIFIQILCHTIKTHSKKEHVNDLFTKVTCNVKFICVSIEREQLPKVEHTLAKKLYLQIPEL